MRPKNRWLPAGRSCATSSRATAAAGSRMFRCSNGLLPRSWPATPSPFGRRAGNGSRRRLFALREVGSRLRRFRAQALASLIDEDWIVRDDFLTIDLAPFVRRTKERMDRLAAARQLVVSDPEILGGAPIVRGTRVPVYDVAGCVAAGLPTKCILAAYPSLEEDQVELAAIYAEASPARGRPRSSDELPEGAVIVADRRAHRRGKAG
ncbi:MAG: DUF433 domain-containing protein [Hyphomicrobiales bacterium]|nr:MAG: DUF433 domain-containing protein [Hyphomicrobiales bacterium]